MGKIHSDTSFDCQPYAIVPVIASFDSKGNIRPLYVRIGGEPHKVDSYCVRYSFAGQIEFNCKIATDDMLRPLSLTYYQKECMWIIQQDMKP